MITLSAKAVVGLVAFVALVLAPAVSRWIRNLGRDRVREAGSGDPPGGPDRGPGGIRM